MKSNPFASLFSATPTVHSKSHRVHAEKVGKEPERKGKKDAHAVATPDFAQLLLNHVLLPVPRLATPAFAVARPAAEAPTRPTHSPSVNPHPANPHPTNAATAHPVTRKHAAEERHSAQTTPAAASPVAQSASPERIQKAREVEAVVAPFAPMLQEDPTLRMTVTANTAAISVQTADAGDLSLYLRVRQGAAELRIEGAAAPEIERRSDELRLALATEGITLQRLEIQTVSAAGASSGASLSADTTDRDRSAPERPEPVELPQAPDAAPAPSETPNRNETGHHVRA